ncbi:hypothetical protein BC835DRAFT_1296561, partial [Cytidiella melzeri]
IKTNYATVKACYPGEGRRKWRIRVAQQFWALPSGERLAYAQTTPVLPTEVENAAYTTDDDPLDSVSASPSNDVSGLGVVVRTDFTDEPAWQAFLVKLQEGEAEFASAVNSESAHKEEDEDESMDEDEDGDDEEAEEDEENESQTSFPSSPPPIFHVLTTPASSLTNISNLSALRLLNDVDIRPIPTPPPPGTKRLRPANRLVDIDGWQEVYRGKMLWIYDARSNMDQCVRVVSQTSASGVYGSATADSWRARVSHICELQVNVASGAMSIDFGGMDRWDYQERVRNMAEAEQ